MKQSTKDQIKGTLHDVTGSVKEKVGKALDSPSLTAEGQNEKLSGKIQKKASQIERVFEK